MKKVDINEFFRRLARANPTPSSDLIYSSHYTLLVAVVLSAQATDESVNKATLSLFSVADTPAEMAALGEKQVRGYIKSIGLFNSKARNIVLLSKMLISEHGGEVPNDRASLESLPGVGRKTANVVLNIAFGEPTIAVDTHVFRVANRTGLTSAKTPLEVEKQLLLIVPKRWKQHAHHWLILHGRYICKARKPNCPACEVAKLCQFKDKTMIV